MKLFLKGSVFLIDIEVVTIRHTLETVTQTTLWTLPSILSHMLIQHFLFHIIFHSQFGGSHSKIFFTVDVTSLYNSVFSTYLLSKHRLLLDGMDDRRICAIVAADNKRMRKV